MRTTLLLKLLFVLVLAAGWYRLSVNPEAAHAMACCSDLNCEGEYYNCVNSCGQLHPGDQTCMDSCYSAAVRCAHTNCEFCTGIDEPCWFTGDINCGVPTGSGGLCSFPSGCPSGFTCMEVSGSWECQSGSTDACGSAGCTFPYVCLQGSCVQAGCRVDPSPAWLDSNGDLIDCTSNMQCPQGYCVQDSGPDHGKCHSCPGSYVCDSGFCIDP